MNTISLKRWLFTALIMISFIACIVRITTVSGNTKYISATEKELSPIEQKLGFSCNKANAYGAVYSVEGNIIAPSGDETLKPSDKAFDEILNNITVNCRNILQSGSLRENNLKAQGNHIQTTFHQSAQQTAYHLAEEILKENHSDGVAIDVVLKDGSTAVDVRSGKVSSSPRIGSSAKVFLSRIMLSMSNQNTVSHSDDDDYSLFNENFTDVSKISVGSRQIANWDSHLPSNYDTVTDDGNYQRTVSLNDALIFSSNTYMITHARYYGFDNVVDKFNQSLYFQQRMYGDTRTFEAVTDKSTQSNIDFFYGQDFCCSPVRFVASANALFTNQLYIPFNIARVFSPTGQILYQAVPEYKTTGFAVDLNTDILKTALQNTYLSYIKGNAELEQYQGILLAKSGTAEISSSKDNRTMLITVLDNTQTDVICSAVISVENVSVQYEPSNQQLIRSLCAVLTAMNVI